MKLKLLLIFILAGTSVFAQTANVVELNPSDAVKAKDAYAELQKAQKDWDRVSAELRTRYKSSDFEFSKDFRFLVPKQTTLIYTGCGSTTSSSVIYSSCWPVQNGGTFTVQ